jgi:hypothetical protein
MLLVCSLQSVVDGFRSKHGMPGCAGAIDGTLLPCKKPTAKCVGADRDAFYGYKGYISHLLLAVVDSRGMFLYASAGAPGSVGDAGLYGRSVLKRNVDQGLLNSIDVNLNVHGNIVPVKPYFVGDTVFHLGRHMLKNFHPAPPDASPQKLFNKLLTNCRREVEIAFGLLKARWAFCKRNTFWNDMPTVREMTAVCCALHNFLTERCSPVDDDWNAVNEADGPVMPLHVQNVPDHRGLGAQLRDQVTAHMNG